MTYRGILEKCITLFLCVFLFNLLTSDNALAEIKVSQKEFAKIAHRCFYQEVRKKIEYIESNYTEAFIAERLFTYFDQPNSDLTSDAARKFCKDQMVPLYVRGFNNAFAEIQQEKSKKPDLAKLSQSIELHDKFAQIILNRFIDHTVTGHTELTGMALNQLPSQLQLGTEAKELVIAASQTPDLYRWSDERYHAHTCTFPDLQTKRCEIGKVHTQRTRTEIIDDSQLLFINLMDDIMAQVFRRVREKSYGRALFWIGVGCHALQDLVYHRGMTLSQHAGLSFVLEESDPDTPKGEIREARIRDAVNYSRRFIEVALTIPEFNVRYLIEWKPDSGHNLREVAKFEFGNDTDMNTFSLYDYWFLSRKYNNEAYHISELYPGPSGLIEWDVTQVISRLLNYLGAPKPLNVLGQ